MKCLIWWQYERLEGRVNWTWKEYGKSWLKNYIGLKYDNERPCSFS